MYLPRKEEVRDGRASMYEAQGHEELCPFRRGPGAGPSGWKYRQQKEMKSKKVARARL